MMHDLQRDILKETFKFYPKCSILINIDRTMEYTQRIAFLS
jgi:hypothetical protein